MSTPTNPEVKELNPVDFIQLQQYIEYCSLKVKDVLREFDKDGRLAQHRHGECINEEGFRQFLKTYLEVDFPPDLCQRLFRSFQNSEPTQEDDTKEVFLKDVSCYFSLLEDGQPRDKLEFAFRLYDRDGNGVLDSSEVDRIIAQMMHAAEYLDWDVSELEPIHTGLQHSIIRATQPNCLPLENITLPQKLKEAGYSTHMVGKWHLGFYKRGCLPTQRGFDTFFGSLLGSGDYYSHYKCEGPGMCGYDLYEGEEAAWEQDRGLYSTVMFTRKAVSILANHDPHKQPLFLYLAYQAVHSPLQVPARYLERYKGIPNPHRRKYAAMVSCLDEAIHNLTLALKHFGYYDNTVIVYSTDNGGQPLAGGSNWPLRGSKATYWEGGIRGVGFVHSPLLVKKGSKCQTLVHITDWFPTLVTLGGGTLDEDQNLDGYDVWEAISEGRPSPRLDILHNIDPIYIKAKNGSWKAGYGLWNTAVQAALRVGHWKLLTGVPGYSDWVPPQTFSNQRLTTRHHNERVRWDRGKSIWLFNITADPYERVDLSQQYPHIVKKMLMRLVQYNKTAVPVRYPAKDLRSNPQYNGGVWGPWYKDEKQERNEEEEEERYNNLFINHIGKRRWKNKSRNIKLKPKAEH